MKWVQSIDSCRKQLMPTPILCLMSERCGVFQHYSTIWNTIWEEYISRQCLHVLGLLLQHCTVFHLELNWLLFCRFSMTATSYSAEYIQAQLLVKADPNCEDMSCEKCQQQLYLNLNFKWEHVLLQHSACPKILHFYTVSLLRTQSVFLWTVGGRSMFFTSSVDCYLS